MHMADALLSPAVGMSMNAVGVAAIGASVAKVGKDEFDEQKIPLMGVAGAMIFAAQMINFSIPGTGSSGHIGGGILLAGLLGGVPAFLSIAAVLIIQCLFFADGGLLALGCNIFNIGVIPCLIVYPLIFRPLLKNGIAIKRLTAASVLSVLIAAELGAFCVVLQTWLSGVSALPFGLFSAFMLPIHFAIGLAEGFITAAILCFIYKSKPEIIDASTAGRHPAGVPLKRLIIAIAAAAILTGGVLSIFASVNPDGLEWAIKKTEDKVKGETIDVSDGAVVSDVQSGVAGDVRGAAANIQEKTAIMPDYAFTSDPENAAGISAAGLAGAASVCLLAAVAGFVISKAKRKKREKTSV